MLRVTQEPRKNIHTQHIRKDQTVRPLHTRPNDPRPHKNAHTTYARGSRIANRQQLPVTKKYGGAHLLKLFNMCQRREARPTLTPPPFALHYRTYITSYARCRIM